MSSALIRGLVALLIIGSAVAAQRTVRDADACKSPRVRHAWCVPGALPVLSRRRQFAYCSAHTARHTLRDEERKAYIDTELCLMSKPATLGLRASRTKFDEFQSAHVLKMEIAHFTARSSIDVFGYV